jgi:quercetin dioxygenase-like cupin family protein
MLTELTKTNVLRQPTIDNSIWYNGHCFSYLVEGTQTEGAFCMIYCHFRKGGEPPAHYHQWEDETFYILEGIIDFQIGNQHITANAGDLAFAPKSVAHHFQLRTDTAKAIMLISPAGIETFFREFGMPAQSLDLPPLPEGRPPAVFIEKMLARAEELGIVWVDRP